MGFPEKKQDLNIRIARKEDAEEIYYLVQRAFLDYVEKGTIPASQETIEDIYNDIKDNIVIVMELDNVIIGSLRLVSVVNGSVQLRRFSIHPDYQHRGMGTFLYLRAEEKARKLHFKYMFLYSSIEDEKLVRFYKKMGFTCLQTDRQNGYERGLWVKNIGGVD